ncbi:protein Wnt-1-like [Anthonomus grandis grandis]|uniref:protein Wnt-1-like n=1 Tax=Anthonomus grandis grandis TaxID=2921223 RepID=UPI0021650519|nr:protein Wnt-1-like [Anthonomus grandis grandis]
MGRPDAAAVLVLLMVWMAVWREVRAADWWQLGLSSTLHPTLNLTPTAHKEKCQKIEFFVEKQRDLCSKYDKILPIISAGAKLAVEECQTQFAFSRWNCTTFPEKNNTFGNVVTIKSREAAYINAISAASMAYAVTRACTKGELAEYCSCDNKIRQRKTVKWKWGGCSDDIRYGEKFSREFLDVQEDQNTALGLMNLHNNEAGRRAVRSRMQRTCKCHGVSGSCSMQICWRRLPSLRKVAEGLYKRYEGASHVKYVERRRKKLKVISPDFKKPNRTDLVYLEDSPDYCDKNDTLNILGTRGRVCNLTSQGIDGCPLLCCGRGYQTRVKDVEEKCDCKFVWCCNVVCETCRFRKEEHVCN